MCTLITPLQSSAPYLCWCAEQARVQQPLQCPVPASLDGQRPRWTGQVLLDSVLQGAGWGGWTRKSWKDRGNIGGERCLPETDPSTLSVCLFLLQTQLESVEFSLADGVWEYLWSRFQGLTLPYLSCVASSKSLYLSEFLSHFKMKVKLLTLQGCCEY